MSNKIYVEEVAGSARLHGHITGKSASSGPTFSQLVVDMQDVASQIHTVTTQVEDHLDALGIGRLPNVDPENNKEEMEPQPESILERLMDSHRGIRRSCSRLGKIAARISSTL